MVTVLPEPDVIAVPAAVGAVPASVAGVTVSVGEAFVSVPEEESSVADASAVGESPVSVVVGVGVFVTADAAAADTLSSVLPSLPSALEMQVSMQ